MDSKPACGARFLVVAGMSRAGTTYLYHHLQRHPEVFTPARKEICYFAFNFDEGWDWFQRFFRRASGRQVLLDVCGHYFTDPCAPQRIRAHLADVRVLLCIRDPLSWLLSMYEHYATLLDVPDVSTFFSGWEYQREGKTLRVKVGAGHIAATIGRFRRVFTGDLLLVDFRLLESDPISLLQAIETFAGLEPFFSERSVDRRKINARNRRRIAVLESLARRRWFIELLLSVVPRSTLLKARRVIDGAAAGRASAASGDDPLSRYSPEDAKFLRDLARSDSDFVARLFRDGPLVWC